MHSLDIIDSHTGGEPTRVVVAGFPDLGGGSLAEQRQRFAQRFDRWRSAVACEPRGSDPVVGALLLPPQSPGARAGRRGFQQRAGRRVFQQRAGRRGPVRSRLRRRRACPIVAPEGDPRWISRRPLSR